MPFLRLRDLRSGETREFTTTEVGIGRDPQSALVITGAGREVVSASHAKLVHRDGTWWIEDAGSRNGTFLDGQRLTPGLAVPVMVGNVLSLGKGGVRIEVDAVRERRISETLVESRNALPATLREDGPVSDDPATSELRRPEVTVALTWAGRTEPFEVRGNPVRMGRGRECEVRPVESSETAVSRVHAEIVLRSDGVAVVRDAGSRHGTLVNAEPLLGDHELRPGDRIKLGAGGPELVVVRLVTPSMAATVAGVSEPAPPQPVPRRSFGGRGRTAFFTDKLAESSRRSARRVRLIVWSFVGLLGVAVGGLYWVGERRAQQTATLLATQQRAAMAAQRATADSASRAARAEYARLEQQLARAQASAAPVAVVESLRIALAEAGERTSALEEALQRAQADLSQQMAAGDSLQRRAETELSRLRRDLRRARDNQVSAVLVDSLRTAVRAAEDRATNLSSQVRAIKGVNLAAVAQGNQSAVGLVTAYFGNELFDGSGFVLTPSGYFVTNRHVVTEDGRRADSLFVTMADQRFMVRSDIVALAPPNGPDLAVLKLASYSGPHIPRVDWTGTRTRQGEPAALIGFPAGLAAALDRSQTVRTSMSAGVFSKVTPDLIQFDGFTVGGSSGSPIFNADGDVVAVHRAGLREAAGLGFAVPIPLLVPLLPSVARAELGLQ